MSNATQKAKRAFKIGAIASIILVASPLILTFIFLVVLIVPFLFGIPAFKQLASLWLNRTKRDLYPVEYTYKKPGLTRAWEAVKFLFKIVLFPLYLWALGIKALLASFIYPKSGLIDLVPVFPFCQIRSPEYDPSSLKFKGVKLKQFVIQMPDDVQIYTCEMVSKAVEETVDMPHIIYFGGNGAQFSDYVDKIRDDLTVLKAKVIGFHHSGFGNSGCAMKDGTQRHVPTLSFSPLVEEGIAQVERLLAKGVAAEKITLYGHSLGGTIAIAVATHFHQQNPPKKIQIFGDRTLSGTGDFAMAALLPSVDGKQEKKTPPTIAQRIRRGIQVCCAYLLKPLIKLVLVLSDWDIDASSFSKIEARYRDYIVVRGRDEEDEIIDDEVIPYGASIHKLGPINAESKQYKQTHGGRDPHKFVGNNFFHADPLSALVNSNGETGSDRFNDFVRKVS
jgi:pimeloyl-ACP methyl ester carboxylesterase